jgi:hypothetical protein
LGQQSRLTMARAHQAETEPNTQLLGRGCPGRGNSKCKGPRQEQGTNRVAGSGQRKKMSTESSEEAQSLCGLMYPVFKDMN